MHTSPYRSPASNVYQPYEAAYDDNLDLDYIATGQKLVIYALLAQLSSLLLAGLTHNLLIDLAADTVLFLAFITSLFGMYRLVSGLGYSMPKKVIWMVLMLVPLFALILMLIGSLRASRALREAGYEVGLLGVKD